MTKIKIIKDKKINLDTLYNRIKKNLLEDKFHITSDVQTDNVYHLRAEKTGVTEIIIGAVKDIELIIAGDEDAFAVVFTAGAWGKNMLTSGSTGFMVASLLAAPAAFYGGAAATGSFVRAVAYEMEAMQMIEKEIEAAGRKRK